MATDASRVGWLYQARRVNTQNNAGGGALTTRLSLASGQIAKLISGYIVGPTSATTLTGYIFDEDAAAMTKFFSVAAGATNNMNLPQIGTSPATSTHTTDSTASSLGLLIGPGSYLVFACAAAAQTETLTVSITLLLYNVSTAPTWDTTGSAGTPSLAASSISAANTLVPVVVNPP